MGVIDTMNIVVSVGLAIIGFFLVQFYFMVKEMAKDVKELLIQRAAHDEEIKQITADVQEIKVKQGHMERNMQKMELQLSKLSK